MLDQHLDVLEFGGKAIALLRELLVGYCIAVKMSCSCSLLALPQNLGKITAANLRKAHALIESGKTIGKLVLSGW